MRQFLAGVVATLVVLALGAGALVLAVGDGAEPGEPPPSPAPSGVRVPPPDDLGDDETWLGAVDLDSREVVSAEGDLVDVQATGTGVRFGPDGLRARTLAIDATIPFDTVAEQVEGDIRLYAVSGGRAGVERPARVLGRDVLVRATGRVSADRGQLLVVPETVDVGAPDVLESVAGAALRRLVTFRTDVPGVPEGMVLREVSVSGAGFAVRLDGTDVAVGR
ncbi:LmeA family phospholipid-binding protein [Phycicoccus sp. CSK15P-2]|uniref:LmeA family phospholipid-binding protein n=1 Tax=Phycicoccus sp. CSK15P-2 TaxID=2807627 RepID=UPI00194F2C48|nr:LmeA family phospholipid-binding protein [Phycicoccus sp. CSK15P-2]MBM6405696.1 LmeA family phospholipid-binding protein [Phycicoccus sp. CSK15P-2]